MIAVSNSGKSFRALAAYLAAGRTGEERDRVAWSAARNLPTAEPELAATFMSATAAQSDRVRKPVYHVAVSFDPADPAVDRATMERVADRVLQQLGLAEHQAVIVAHRDRAHQHLHLLINRVHPETHTAWDRWRDRPVIERVLRDEERALGLRVVQGRLAPSPERDTPEHVLDSGEQGGTTAPDPIHRTLPRSDERQTADAGAAGRRTTEDERHSGRASDSGATRDAHPRDLRGVELREGPAGAIPQAGTPEHAAREPRESHTPERAEGRDAGPTTERAPRPDSVPTRLTRVEEVATSLRGYERVVELAQEQYDAMQEASGARARVLSLDMTATRARTTVTAFEQALATVYREPEYAYGAYLRFVDERGLAAATRALREQPEQFGALQTVERTKAFGLLREVDEGQARAALPGTAARGREAVEALGAFWESAAEARASRIDEAFTRELKEIYRETKAVRTAFERLAAEQGVERAASTLREAPHVLGELQARVAQAPAALQAHAARAAELGVEAHERRAIATAVKAKMREGRVIREAPDPRLKDEPAESRGDQERATAREAALRTERSTYPDRAELERHLAQLLDRLSPREVRQLRRTVEAPQFALAMEIRTTVRDVLLGRDDERAR